MKIAKGSLAMLIRTLLSLLILSTIILAGETSLQQAVAPFLKEHCIACHGPEKQKGKLRLDTLKTDFTDAEANSKWAEVVKQVNAHQMPPEDEPQPAVAAVGKFAEVLEAALAEGEIARRSARVCSGCV